MEHSTKENGTLRQNKDMEEVTKSGVMAAYTKDTGSTTKQMVVAV